MTGNTHHRRKIILLLTQTDINILTNALTHHHHPNAPKLKHWIQKCWDMDLKPNTPWHPHTLTSQTKPPSQH